MTSCSSYLIAVLVGDLCAHSSNRSNIVFSCSYSTFVSLNLTKIWFFSVSVMTSISLIFFVGASIISCRICSKCAAILRMVSSWNSLSQNSQFTVYPSDVALTVTVRSNWAILDSISTVPNCKPSADISSNSLFCSTNNTSKIGFLDISLFTFTLSTTSSKGYS
ncbi:hypothetical protein D3C74_148200 [compost metagenome]